MTYEEFKIISAEEVEKAKSMVALAKSLGAERITLYAKANGRITLDIDFEGDERHFAASFFGDDNETLGLAEYDTSGEHWEIIKHEYIFPEKDDEVVDDLPFT